MPPAPDKIASLRHLLAERFPGMTRQAGRVLMSGIASLDAAQGGFPLGSVTELVALPASSGGHSVLAQLLSATRTSAQRVALVDAAHCFDPASLPLDHLAHL